jgi:undecaprenyl-diphosphatase
LEFECSEVGIVLLPYFQDFRFSILPRQVKSRLKLYRMRCFLGIFFFSVIGIVTPAFGAENNSTSANLDQHLALDYADAMVYGLVEGLTEFLPVSSTGHLILTKEWMGKANEEDLQSALNAYLIVIQVGAILAVALLYRRDVWAMGLGLIGLDPRGRALASNVFLAFLPAAAIGPFLDEFIEKRLFGALPVAVALLVGAGLMFAAERMRTRRERADAGASIDLSNMRPIGAFVIGLMQCVAMCPGTSRSMMTIVGGYLVGLRPAKAAEFSFLLGLVTLTAAAGYKTVTRGEEMLEHLEVGPVILGCFVAGISAALAVRWLVGFLSRRGLALFAWYRILLATVIFVMIGMDLMD